MKRALMFLLCMIALSSVCAFAEDAPADNAAPPADYDKYLQDMRRVVEIQRQAREMLAEQYVKSGLNRYEERKYDLAEEDFERAIAANPNHPVAKEYLLRTRRILGKTKGGDDDLLPREMVRRQVELGYQQANMLKLMEDSRQALREGSFDTALVKLSEARNIAKVLATHTDVAKEVSEISVMTDQAAIGSKKVAEETERRKLEQARTLAESERKRDVELYRRRIERMFEDAKYLFGRTRYLDAARKADEILKIDPRNKEVMAFRDRAYEMQVAEELRQNARTDEMETAFSWRQSQWLSTPFSQVDPIYPNDWDEKKKRTAGIQIESESPEEIEWKQKIEGVLDERVSFDFIATPLDDVVAFLRNLKRVNIVVDRQAVATRGNLDVTLRIDQLKFRDAMEWILRQLDLKYALENGAIYISTKEKIAAAKKTVTRYYDVNDLTVEIKNFKPNLQAISSGNLGQDDSAFSDIFSEDIEAEGEPDQFTGESLVEFIKSVIAAGTWDEVVGGGGDDFGF